MKRSFCPVCYTQLTIVDVTPCIVCGGWDGSVQSFDKDDEFNEYKTTIGTTFILCKGCWIEEMLSLQGDLARDLNLPVAKGSASGYIQLRSIDSPAIQKDKYCRNCHKRLAYLKLCAEDRIDERD